MKNEYKKPEVTLIPICDVIATSDPVSGCPGGGQDRTICGEYTECPDF